MRFRTDIDNEEMVTTDDGDCIPAQYQLYLEVFRKKQAKVLPLPRHIHDVINLEPNSNLQ
jgi:hypothetical protein